jgi:hypothetical protein
MLAAGVDPVTVARVIGHKDASVTLAIYAAPYNRSKSDNTVRLAFAL